jgi:hypothetical protein
MRSWFHRQQLTAANLTLGGVALALLSVWLWALLSGTQAQAILATPPKKMEIAATSLDSPTSVVDFEVIQARPLFHQSRTYYVPPDPEAMQARLTPPDYRIVGAMAMPKQPLAAILLNNQTGARLKVAVGDILDGWTVEEVTDKRVALTMDGHHQELGTGSNSSAQVPATGFGLRSVPRTSGTQNANSAAQTDGAPGIVRTLSGGSQQTSPSAGGANSGNRSNNDGARLYRPPTG